MTYELGSIGEGKSAAEIKNIIKRRQQAYSEVRDYLVGNNRQATQLFNERRQKDRANQIYRNTRLSRYVDTITGVIASPGYQRYSFKGDIPAYAEEVNWDALFNSWRRLVKESLVYGKAAIIIAGENAVINNRTPLDFIDVVDNYGETVKLVDSAGTEYKEGAFEYNGVPFVVLRRTSEAQPYLYLIKDSIDAIDRVLMNWMRQHDRNNNIYMATPYSLSNAELEAFNKHDVHIMDGVDPMLIKQVGTYTANAGADLILKAINSGLQEMTGIPDYEQLTAGNDPSGTALMMRLTIMVNTIAEFENAALEALRLFVERYIEIWARVNKENIGEFPKIDIDRNIPQSQTANIALLNLAGASKRTIWQAANLDPEVEQQNIIDEQGLDSGDDVANPFGA